MSRQTRQFRLSVDEEETSLPHWRVNTPPVQSGELESRNKKENDYREKWFVNPHIPIRNQPNQKSVYGVSTAPLDLSKIQYMLFY
jgi:hypothetical protein